MVNDFEQELLRILNERNKEIEAVNKLLQEAAKKDYSTLLHEKTKEDFLEQNRKKQKIKKLHKPNRFKTMKKLIFILLLLAAVYFAYHMFVNKDTKKDIERSLTTTPIEKLLADPRYYENKEVSVYGTVESSFSLGIKYYVLNDKTGTIYIITEKGVPQEGEFVQVTGIFNQRIKIGNLQVETITEKQ